MKILWIGNIVLPDIADKEKLVKSIFGGWLVNLAKILGVRQDINLVYVFDNDNRLQGELDYCKYYGLPCKYNFHNRPNKKYINDVCDILKNENPDIIHIWGTEYPHCYGVIEACEITNNISRTVVSIQGLISFYAKQYTAYLPFRIVHGYRLSDIKYGNVFQVQNRFKKKGILEKISIQKVNHVIGRTDWDRACVWNINPNAEYHFNNETLRQEFYDGDWHYDNCEKHSIFMSQAAYPIKGIHLILQELNTIIRRFPDTKLYVAGYNFAKKNPIKMRKYEKYCMDIIKKNDIEDHVEFIGELNAHQMKERYLKSNVFVSCSSIENSSNSIGEAMMLGVPVVASNVGGTHNLFIHGEEGYLYPADETYMLSYYVCKLFSDVIRAKNMAFNAKIHARKTHDSKTNLFRLLDIYNGIAQQ